MKSDCVWKATLSGYLQKKQIEAAGMKMVPDSKTLMIPMQDAKGKIWSVQFIDEKGEKRFIKEGRKEGLFHHFGDLKDDAKQLYIAEGVATAATIHHATGKPALAAFDCGNLKPVTVKTYLTPAERDQLYDDAARRGVSASKYIRLILKHHVQAQTQPPVKPKIKEQ